MLKIYKIFAFFKTRIKRLAAITAWIMSRSFFYGKGTNERRVLLVYDLSSQPFSIGDFIVAQIASIAECQKLKLRLADIAIVYEKTGSSKEFSSITNDDVLYYLASILPVVQINQNVGSVFIFNSHDQLEKYILENVNTYHIWPNLFQYAGGDYLHIEGFNNILYNYFEEYGEIPHFQCRQFLIEWAEKFYQNNVGSCIPVTLNLRNNKLFGTNRNSKIECWLELFKFCENKYPVKFIIIGGINEVDYRMREFKNVLIAKDFHTGIEQDLALINLSAFHMGASSGPSAMAIFGVKPYLSFSWDADPKRYKGVIESNGYYSFTWSAPLQRMSKESEKTEILIEEFKTIWKSIDTKKYLKDDNIDLKKEKIITWLR